VGVATTTGTRNNNKEPNVSETETTAKPMSASEEENDPLQVLTEAYLGTPKFAEAMPRQSPSHNQCQSQHEVTFAYYPFLYINNLSSLHTDDINYLDAQGCFKLPESNCLDHLVRTFFQHAHPILPVVNEAEFWSAYDPSTSGCKTSRVPVLLLLAMLFVACKYVDDDVLQGMQHDTAQEARDSFLRKTQLLQLLYNQETESSPLILAQVSLLLAHWSPHKSLRTNRPSSQWLGRAIQHSQDAIYQAKVSTSVKSHFSQGNLRRLLGCCILSDCIHSLYTRRPPMMLSGMIEAEGNFVVLSRTELSHEIGRSRVYSAEEKQQFIEAQEQMSSLIRILRRVLALIYPQGGMATCRPASMFEGEEYKFRDCKSHFKTWYNDNLMPLISGSDSALGSPVSLHHETQKGSSQSSPIELLVSMMHLHYEMAMLAICETELLHLAANPQATYSSYMRIFCTAPPLFTHLLNTSGNIYNKPSSPNVSSLSLSMQEVGVQCARDPQWARKIMKCLGMDFRDELDYILQAVKVANDSLAESLEDIQESPILLAEAEEMKIGNWRELLDTRPRLYIHLVERLNSVISWGGPLPEAGMVGQSSKHQILPHSSMTHPFQPGNSSWKWVPSVSSAPAQRRIKHRTSAMAYRNERTAQLQVSKTDSGCLQPEGLRENSSNALVQKVDLAKSCLDQAPCEVYSPISLDTSRRPWAEEIADSSSDVLDQAAFRDDNNHTEIEFTDIEETMLVDGQSDKWIDMLLQNSISD
ncbi:hypothetical protein LB504_007188, partial [Fusarium proliferatum]